MTIATPVATALAGRNAMIDGLWTLRTVSPSICSGSPLRASDPGAPFGHSTIVGWPGGMTTAGGFGGWRGWRLRILGSSGERPRERDGEGDRNGSQQVHGRCSRRHRELCAGLSHRRDQSTGAGGAASGARNWRTEAISASDVDGLARTPSNTLFSGPS